MSQPQNSFLTYPNVKNSPLGPQKVKMTPKLSQNQMSELKETKKKKLFNYMSTPQNQNQRSELKAT